MKTNADILTQWQETFITLGFIYRNYEAANKIRFWQMLKNNSCILDVVVYCYGALVVKKEIEKIEDLEKNSPEVYAEYLAGSTRFDPQADPAKIRKIIIALHTFKYLRAQ